jgi:hypothetical protein
MKKQLNSSIKAHLIRGAFLLLLLAALCAIPFALAQRNTTKQSGARQTVAPRTSSGAVGSGSIGVRPLPKGGQVVLYDQYDNATVTPPVDITSQDFEPDFDAFDTQAADDFVVPAGETWNIEEVDVLGEYNGGPAESFHVFFYQDAGGLPGTLVDTRLANPFTGDPDFVITLTSPVILTAGTYWVSVQSRQDFGTAGQWFWHNRDVQSGSGAAWQNPGDGFATGCTTWVTKTACALLGQTAPDQVFRLNGTIGGPTPTPTPTATPTPPRVTPTPRPRGTPRPRP